jgi:hypothetical protein
MATIEDLLHRRTDLSTFLVHFTRSYGNRSARQNLIGILRNQRIEARKIHGMADQLVKQFPALADGQKTVCFTETPLEHAWMMCSSIDGRRVQFDDGYGIAFTKTLGRCQGVNPVCGISIRPPAATSGSPRQSATCSTRQCGMRPPVEQPSRRSMSWPTRRSCASPRSSNR